MSRLLAPLLAIVSACASAPTLPNDADYVIAYLKTGPASAQKTSDENQAIFAGHMANIHRLAEERKLLVAGPFDHPHDATWRGIFVLDVATIAEARALVDTDPGVKAQVFVAELYRFHGSPALRRTFDLEQAAKSSAPKDQMDVRPYVMVTAQDAVSAEDALAALRERGRIVWSGTFGGTRAGQGVFVIDAQKVEEAELLLGDQRARMGDCSIDSWWSARSLAGLAGTSNGAP